MNGKFSRYLLAVTCIHTGDLREIRPPKVTSHGLPFHSAVQESLCSGSDFSHVYPGPDDTLDHSLDSYGPGQSDGGARILHIRVLTVFLWLVVLMSIVL